ncbi:peptidase inhibitor family I36 protein [Geodermatophilus sp. SYSU D00965]
MALKRNLVLAAAATTLGIGGVLLPGATAMAATTDASTTATSVAPTMYEKDGWCDAGEFCLYYMQNYGGDMFDLYLDDADFSDDGFSTNPGRAADNNTRSYWNNDSYTWRVYDGYGYTGDELLCISPGDRGNFSSFDWDRASSATYSTTPC